MPIEALLSGVLSVTQAPVSATSARVAPLNLFRLKALRDRDRRPGHTQVGAGDEVIMSHPKKTPAASPRVKGDDGWSSSANARDWDTDTDVMPPEYCRQLLEISRRLQGGK